MPLKMHPQLRGVLARFSLWIANGTVGNPILDGIDYTDILRDPSAMEMVYTVFTNNLELDRDGAPLNARYSEQRAAQWLRQYCDPTYVVTPAFTSAECEGHWPPVLENAPEWKQPI
ncbi:hypothetical protein LQT97_13230 [Brucella pseudogrignonensis]|uniref:DUF7677 family protein n=1 Tax=Brucella pseudogrignonensis TaxID=419475 RepID=UPI001E637C3D|nr:hypothetical protein [Brucella pseudogrignonensis]MCD4512192.1 hypothetical protein [Brucella pseudogrignonensis]